MCLWEYMEVCSSYNYVIDLTLTLYLLLRLLQVQITPFLSFLSNLFLKRQFPPIQLKTNKKTHMFHPTCNVSPLFRLCSCELLCLLSAIMQHDNLWIVLSLGSLSTKNKLCNRRERENILFETGVYCSFK